MTVISADGNMALPMASTSSAWRRKAFTVGLSLARQAPSRGIVARSYIATGRLSIARIAGAQSGLGCRGTIQRRHYADQREEKAKDRNAIGVR